MKLKGDYPISYHVDLIIKKKKNKKDIPNLRYILHHILFFFSLIVISFLLLISSHQSKEIDKLFMILYPIQTKVIELHTMVTQLQKEIDNQTKNLQININTYNISNQSFEESQSIHKELYQNNVKLQSRMSVNNVLSQSKIFCNKEELDEVGSYVKNCDIMIETNGQRGLDLFPRSYGDLTKTINDSLFTLGESEFLINELEVFEFVNKEYQ